MHKENPSEGPSLPLPFRAVKVMLDFTELLKILMDPAELFQLVCDNLLISLFST